MIKKLKYFIIALLSIIVMSGAALAVGISDFHVSNVGGSYKVFLTLNNNGSNDAYVPVYIGVDELGISKAMNNGNAYLVPADSSKTLIYDLSDVVDPSKLSVGSVYTLYAHIPGNSRSTNFLFGNEVSSGLGLMFKEVKIDGVDVNDYSDVNVDVGENVQITVIFQATQNYDDARLRAEIDGYEHGVLSDTTNVFKVVAGNVYKKTFTIHLPEDMNTERVYKLRIYGVSDLSGLTYKEYNLYVDAPRHNIQILDMITTPATGIEPGQNLIANVRLKNIGQNTENSIKVTVSIPALNVSESTYVSSLDRDTAVTTDDLLLYIPNNAKPGKYNVVVKVTYNGGFSNSEKDYSIYVSSPQKVGESGLIVSYKNYLNLESDKTYELDVVVANPGDKSVPVSISVVNPNWAAVDVEPTLRMIEGGSDAVFKVRITPYDDVYGNKSFTMLVKEGDRVVKTLDVDAQVNSGSYVATSGNTYSETGSGSGLTWNLGNIILAILLVIAVLIFLSIIAAIANKNNSEDDYQGGENNNNNEEYY